MIDKLEQKKKVLFLFAPIIDDIVHDDIVYIINNFTWIKYTKFSFNFHKLTIITNNNEIWDFYLRKKVDYFCSTTINDYKVCYGGSSRNLYGSFEKFKENYKINLI